jgi:hypothetical protein
MLRIPRLVYEDIEPAAFVDACQKLMPAAKPKFSMSEIVLMKGTLSRKLPAMVAGLESRQGKEWHYHLIRPRDYDGTMERVVATEDELIPFNVHRIGG